MSKDIHIVFQLINFFHNNESDSYNLSDAEKLLLITLASHKGKLGIFPSISTLAKETKKAPSTISRLLSKLRSKGLININYASGKTSHYILLKLSTTHLTDERGTQLDPSHGREDSPLTDERGTPLTDERVITKLNNRFNNKEGEASPLTDDFELTKETAQKICELGFNEEEANFEIDKFMTYYMGKGTEKSDWNMVLQNWMIRAKGYKNEKRSNKPIEIRSSVPWYYDKDRQMN